MPTELLPALEAQKFFHEDFHPFMENIKSSCLYFHVYVGTFLSVPSGDRMHRRNRTQLREGGETRALEIQTMTLGKISSIAFFAAGSVRHENRFDQQKS